MDEANAAKVFAALGHEGRVAIFRILMNAGPEGVSAGEIARRTDQLQNTTSSNLNVLSNAGLISPRREGRSIIYTVCAKPLVNAVAIVTAAHGPEPTERAASPLTQRPGPT